MFQSFGYICKHLFKHILSVFISLKNVSFQFLSHDKYTSYLICQPKPTESMLTLVFQWTTDQKKQTNKLASNVYIIQIIIRNNYDAFLTLWKIVAW